MAYAIVYSPFNGTQGGQNNYCDGTAHNPGVLCCGESDLYGYQSQYVYFRAGYVKSIRTTRVSGLCLNPPGPPNEWVDEGVKVEMFCNENGGGVFVGTVYYGHLVNRIANGLYNYPDGLYLGRLGSVAPGGCYGTIFHVHMECDQNGYRYPRNCSVPIYTSTPIYRWIVPDNCPWT